MAGSLPLRLVVTFVAVSLAALVLLSSIFTAVLASSARSVHLADMRAESSSLARQLDTALARGVPPLSLQRLLVRDSALLGERIILLNAQGQIRFDSAQSTPFAAGRWRTIDVRALRHGKMAHLDVPGGVGLQSPLLIAGRSVGAVTLVGASSSTGVPWGAIIPSLVRALVALLAVWLVVALVIARSLSRPLRHLSKGLVSVRNGELDVAVPEQGWSEARQLARRYNEMVAEVARSRQIQRDFVANAAHELKTPVAIVSGFARALSDGTAEQGGAVDDAVEYIRRESDHLGRIVDQLFALARLDADTNPLCRRTCWPTHVIEDAANRFRERAWAAGMAVNVDAEPNLPVCRWDVDLMVSAMSNIIDNALAHSCTTAIYLSAFVRGEEVVLQVRDVGKGMGPDEIPHLFDRFYRGSGRRREGHAGLGLALVKEIVERHGGSVSVTAQLGVGTSFDLSLPMDTSPSALDCGGERQSA